MNTAAPAVIASPDCRVIVSDDRLCASIAAPVGEEIAKVPVQRILACLVEAGLTPDEKIAAMLASLAVDGIVQIDQAIVVAQGTEPVHAVSARLEVIEEPQQEHVEGNHYARSHIRICCANEPIARLIPAIVGQAGQDVFGQPIEFREDPAPEAKIGANVRLDPGTGIVTGACEGSVHVDLSEVHVEEVLHINGNVDFSTGNIRFKGDVLIDGSVQDLFEIHARNVTIHRTVDAAHIEAAGNFHSDGGIVGKGKGVFRAGADLAVRYISGATVHCDGPITVLAEINNSHITCNGRLTLSRGSIVRSYIAARGGVIAHSIGSEAELQTIIEVGVSAESADAFWHKYEHLHDRRAEVERMSTSLNSVMRNPARLSPAQRGKAEKLLGYAAQERSAIAAALAALAAEWRQLLQSSSPEIEVTDRIYPGAVFRFPGLQATVQSEIRGPVKIVVREIDHQPQIVAIYLNRHTQVILLATPLPIGELLHKLSKLAA
jgi:uncharacterized protein